MKIYDVHMPVAAVCLVKGVEAESEELAIKKAWRQLHDITSTEIPNVEDWAPYIEMVQGTYCAVPDPDAWADLTDELEELEPDVDWGNQVEITPVKVKNAPAGFAEPDAGAHEFNQVQDTPEKPSRQELKETIAAVAMVVAGLRIELTEEYGGEEAYRMLIKMFQLACMSPETIDAEARAAEMYLKKKGK